MPKVVQVRRGTTSALSSVTGAEGELFVDTDKETVTVHNNYQAGGFPLMREDFNNAADNTLPIAKVSRSGGTAFQGLRLNAAGNALEWASSGRVHKVTYYFNNTRYALSDSADTVLWTTNFVKDYADDKSYILAQGTGAVYNSYSDYVGLYADITTAANTAWGHTTNDSKAFSGMTRGDDGQQWQWTLHKVFDYAELDAGTHTLEVGWRVRSGGASNKPGQVWNPNSGDDNRNHTRGFWITFMEILK